MSYLKGNRFERRLTIVKIGVIDGANFCRGSYLPLWSVIMTVTAKLVNPAKSERIAAAELPDSDPHKRSSYFFMFRPVL